MLSIKNNLMAANAARHLGTSYTSLAKSVERLSSGLRINSAKDDAAGLAVRELIRGDVAQLNQAARNAQDAVSMLQTAEGAMAVIDDLLVRMKELAEQAATGSYSAAQITIMNNEYIQLGAEITRIANSTTFNGTSLLDNTTAVSFHLGSASISFTPVDVTAGATGLAVDATPNSTTTGTHGRNYATTVDSIYIQAADITNAATDEIGINFATDSNVEIDIGAYAATGITLAQLVSALNTQAIVGDWTAADTAFASAVYDSSYSAYRLKVTALTAGAGNNMTVGHSNGNDVAAFDNVDDWTITQGAADGGSVSLVTDAAAALTAVSTAITTKDTYRAKLGYYMNRLEAANSILTIQAENLGAAESRISDVDVATEMANMTRNQVLAQAGISMLAQANSMPQMALTANDAIAELNDAADWTKTASGGGTFVYTYDSVTRTVTVTEDTTLEGLRDLINNDAQNPGVSASILEYNSTFHLVLAGKDTGTSYSMTVDNLSTTIEGFDTPDFVETQTAQDIQLRVDGYPAAAWITRDSNTVTDVIPNVTITAKTTGTTSINITRDTSLLQSDLSNLTLVYNGMVDKITEYAGYNDETEVGGVLQGDTRITRLLDTLRSGVTSAVPGFLSGTDTFTLASEIGLEFGQTDENGLPVFEEIGKMFLNDTVLSSALTSDYRGVLDLIGGSGTGTSDNNDIQFTSSHDSTEGGTYNVRVDFDAGGTVTLAMIKKDGESVWRNMTISASDGKLTGQVGNAEQYLNLTAVWDTTGAYTATGDVRVRQGFGNVLYDRVSDLLDNVTGVIAAKREHYDSAIETVDKNIEFQERLLASKEMYLTEKYARMETALAKLDAQRAAFDALFSSLDSNSNSNSDD